MVHIKEGTTDELLVVGVLMDATDFGENIQVSRQLTRNDCPLLGIGVSATHISWSRKRLSDHYNSTRVLRYTMFFHHHFVLAFKTRKTPCTQTSSRITCPCSFLSHYFLVSTARTLPGPSPLPFCICRLAVAVSVGCARHGARNEHGRGIRNEPLRDAPPHLLILSLHGLFDHAAVHRGKCRPCFFYFWFG